LDSENFEESGSADDWENGELSSSEELTQFLGPAVSDDVVSTVLTIPKGMDNTTATGVTLEFMLYQIDEWEAGDSFSVAIGNSTVSLGNLLSRSNVTVTGEFLGITWSGETISEGSDLGFGRENDAINHVTITVPSSYLEDGGTSLHVGFSADTTTGVWGVDDGDYV
jgi:hypothetical protein